MSHEDAPEMPGLLFEAELPPEAIVLGHGQDADSSSVAIIIGTMSTTPRARTATQSGCDPRADWQDSIGNCQGVSVACHFPFPVIPCKSCSSQRQPNASSAPLLIGDNRQCLGRLAQESHATTIASQCGGTIARSWRTLGTCPTMWQKRLSRA